MKKLSILLITLLLLGCSNKSVEPKEENNEIEPIEKVEEVYTDDNPITVGLYENDYSLVTEYYTSKTSLKDLVFTTYFTNDSVVTGGSTKTKWYNYYNKYSDIDNYRIGYNITFNVGEEVISKKKENSSGFDIESENEEENEEDENQEKKEEKKEDNKEKEEDKEDEKDEDEEEKEKEKEKKSKRDKKEKDRKRKNNRDKKRGEKEDDDKRFNIDDI